MTFKPIETQEALDAIIKDRVERAKESARKEAESKFADYDDLVKKLEDAQNGDTEKDNRIKELEEQIAGGQKKVSDLEGELNGLKTEKQKFDIAREVGLPYEMASRITGDTPESMKEDAEMLKGFVAPKKSAPSVSHDPDDSAESERRSELRKFLNGMRED